MTSHVAHYSVTSGLAGCYMPDSVSGPYSFEHARDLWSFIKSEIEFQDWPACEIRQVSLRRLWGHIARHGSSSAHFSIQRGGYEIAFHGLTEAEAEQMEAEQHN